MKPSSVERALFICVLGAFLCQTTRAQRADRSISQFQHTGWTAKDGAPNGITEFAQTSDGYLWLVTDSGLYRFDGIQFEPYKPPSGQELKSSAIASLKAISGGLWIGFSYGGAELLKDGRIVEFGEREGLPPGVVRGFAQGNDGIVWAAASGGLARFDGSRWQLIGQDRGYSTKSATMVFVDRSGTLWVTSEDALFFLSRGETVFQKCADHLAHPTYIGQASDGTLLLMEMHPGEPTQKQPVRAMRPIPLLPAAKALPRIVEIIADGDFLVDHVGSLWITSSDGLFRVPYPDRLRKDKVFQMDEGTAERFTEKDGLTSNFALRTFEDSDGNIWIATLHGLDRFRESDVVPSLSGFAPILLAGDHGDVVTHTSRWCESCRSPHDYLVHLRGMKASFELVDISPTASDRASNGSTWLGGAWGLWSYENGRLVEHPLPEETGKQRDMQAIAQDRTGALWVSIVRSGVYRWKHGVWSHFGNLQDLPKLTPVCLLTDSVGRTWFGYMGSQMAVFDGDRVRTYSSSDGLKVVNIQAIYERAGRVWIGGERGVAVLKGDHFQSLTPDGKAEFAGVSGIVETANGDLWLNATPGIFHIPAGEIERAIKETAHHVQYELFDVKDGLTAGAVQLRPLPTLVESSDERLWFSIYGGIVQIDLNHLHRNAVPPSVYIRSLEAGNAVYSTTDEIKLSPRTTNVHFEYTAPNLSIPERVQYRYKLTGSDKEWQDVGPRREAFYTNLGPGHYTFQVVACNENGVWNNVGATMNFVISPAWFQTKWFLALCIATGLLMVWALYRMRLQQVAKAMSVRFDDRLSERTRIARDLHDTLLQTIQGSKLVADSALKQTTDPSRMHGALEQLSIWLGRATEEGRAALNSLRTSTTEANDLAEAFQRAIEECGIENSMEASFSVVGDTREMHPIVRDEVYRIGYEAIRNACVHSQARNLQVTLTYADELGLRVSDNGVGIDPLVADRGKEDHFGLKGMRERATRIAGKLTVTSSPASGTEVQLVVPGRIIYRKTASDSEQPRVHS